MIGVAEASSMREGVRQDLERDIATELGIARAIDLAPAPRAKRVQDFMRAESRAGDDDQFV